MRMPVHKRTVRIVLPCPHVQRIERRQAEAIGRLKVLEELSHQLWGAALGMCSIPLAGQDEEIRANELL